jgi:predicted nucleotidyltransferase component of viral defense system
MIKQEAYTTEWLDSKVKEYEANSYDLAEKMTYAFTLLEHLKLKGLDFIFKGGTSLVLMIDDFHRFSKDIDIIIPKKPENLTEIFDAVVADTPFVRWELSERKNDEFHVPKEHYKFLYNESKPSKFPEKPVLLDIIFVESSYPETQTVKVKHAFLSTEEPYAEIIIPTFDSIAGDKLTAFAPKTIGIPMGKGKAVEIAKQLFDLNLLFDKISSYNKVGQSFEKTAEMCITHYKRNYTLTQIYDDVIETSFTMAMMGKHDEELYAEIKSGVSALSQYLNKKTNFSYN